MRIVDRVDVLERGCRRLLRGIVGGVHVQLLGKRLVVGLGRIEQLRWIEWIERVRWFEWIGRIERIERIRLELRVIGR